MDPQPTSPTSADPGFANALRALGEIEAAGKSETLTALPPLKFVQDKSAIEEFIERLTAAIGKWLEKLFGGTKNVDMGLLKNAVYIGFWVLVAVLVLTLAFIVYRLWKNRRAPAPVLRAPPSKVSLAADDELAARLATAVTSGDLALASRLRWRLFLKRSRQLSSVTPREYFARKDETLHAQAYDLMFRARASDLPAYRAFDEALIAREPKS